MIQSLSCSIGGGEGWRSRFLLTLVFVDLVFTFLSFSLVFLQPASSRLFFFSYSLFFSLLLCTSFSPQYFYVSLSSLVSAVLLSDFLLTFRCFFTLVSSLFDFFFRSSLRFVAFDFFMSCLRPFSSTSQVEIERPPQTQGRTRESHPRLASISFLFYGCCKAATRGHQE